MNPTAGDQARALLLTYALAQLGDGRRPEQAFADLVALGIDRRTAAVAVCAACGTPWEAAQARMTGLDDLWASLADGPAQTAGSLLELYGFFDREVELSPEQTVIAGALNTAMAQAEYVPHGFANQVRRQLRTGRLREAFLALEELGARQWPDNGPFWSALVTAAAGLDRAELLDAEVSAARRRCENLAGRAV